MPTDGLTDSLPKFDPTYYGNAYNNTTDRMRIELPPAGDIAASGVVSLNIDTLPASGVPVSQVVSPDVNYFNAILDDVDVRAGVEVQSATALKKIYITSFCISASASGAYWLQDEDGGQITSKFALAARGGVVMNFTNENPLVLDTANKALEVKSDAAGFTGVTVGGYII